MDESVEESIEELVRKNGMISNKGMFGATIYIENGTMMKDSQRTFYCSPKSYALEVVCDSPATASLVAIFMQGAITNKPVKIQLNERYLESVSMLIDPEYVTTPDYVIIRYGNKTVLRTSEERIDKDRTFYDFMNKFCKEQLGMIPQEKKDVYITGSSSN